MAWMIGRVGVARRTTVGLLVLAYALAWSGQLFSASQLPVTAPASQPADSQSAPAGEPLAAEAPAVSVPIVADSAPAAAEPLANHDGGYVDWKNCQVVAQGWAKARSHNANDVAMARRAARLVAARNAVLLLQGIHFQPGGHVPGVRNGQIDVDTLLEDFQELSSTFNRADLTVRATLTWQLPAGACPATLPAQP